MLGNSIGLDGGPLICNVPFRVGAFVKPQMMSGLAEQLSSITASLLSSRTGQQSTSSSRSLHPSNLLDCMTLRRRMGAEVEPGAVA